VNQVSVSLIVTTYNWPDALNITIKSALNQTLRPDEIIIADDGSGPETVRAVRDVLWSSDIRWYHVWHEDKGVRQSRIKNLAVSYSSGEYLIFIDQDVLLHPYFIEDHIRMAKRGVFLQGKRVFLSKTLTWRIISNGKAYIPDFFTLGLSNRKNALRIIWASKILSREKEFQTTLRGSNLSMYREDFMKVDGFDEVYDGIWGREDSDLCYRMFHSGIKCKNLWFSAIQYHFHHGSSNKEDIYILDREIKKMLREKRKRAIKGISKLSSEGMIVASSR
jgi:glycosyltransferase involved in cell wall biosynthesis